jgi:hypothetical protein
MAKWWRVQGTAPLGNTVVGVIALKEGVARPADPWEISVWRIDMPVAHLQYSLPVDDLGVFSHGPAFTGHVRGCSLFALGVRSRRKAGWDIHMHGVWNSGVDSSSQFGGHVHRVDGSGASISREVFTVGGPEPQRADGSVLLRLESGESPVVHENSWPEVISGMLGSILIDGQELVEVHHAWRDSGGMQVLVSDGLGRVWTHNLSSDDRVAVQLDVCYRKSEE